VPVGLSVSVPCSYRDDVVQVISRRWLASAKHQCFSVNVKTVYILPDGHTHTHTHGEVRTIGANVPKNRLLLEPSFLIIHTHIVWQPVYAPGAHLSRRRGCLAAASPPTKIQKNKFCIYYDIKLSTLIYPSAEISH
jgi:hypothetical protein